MATYYNEIDSYAAQWLRHLIAAKHIPDGEVDERSISDVVASDLRVFTQHHFFAGLGGWSHALDLAGWSRDRPVWTGSCPCQPFSEIGAGAGFADERHLWPHWFHLIEQCRPPVIFGEQVASKQGLGWLDLVQGDLEGAGYATSAFDLCAASVGAPHIRQRLFFVGDSQHPRLEGQSRNEHHGNQPGWVVTQEGGPVPKADPVGCSFWEHGDWLRCTDGRFRTVETGSFPLGNGIPARVGKLRAYGNAIVPQVAAELIKAYMEIRS